MTSAVFVLYNWRNGAVIWEPRNLWAQLCVCVKDITYTSGGGSFQSEDVWTCLMTRFLT